MIKTFPIEFLRKTLEQTLLKQHYLNNKYFGGKDQISLSSFYQQLKSQDEVDRFVETFRDLSEQQNRMNLIGNGILMSPENPTITNLYSSLIIPFSWTCSIRVLLENRDQMLDTINNLIKELKGRKVDVAQLNSVNENGFPHSEPFMVGTIGENDGEPQLENGVYVGAFENAEETIDKLNEIFGVVNIINNKANYFYCENQGKLKVAEKSKGESFDLSEYTQTIVETVYDRNERLTKVKVKITSQSAVITGLPHLYELENGTISIDTYSQGTIDASCKAKIYQYELDDNNFVNIFVELELNNSISDEYIEEIALANVDIHYAECNFIANSGADLPILFPPEHDSFEKYKLSLSFDSLRCDTPRTLNENEYCEISFGGSATLVNNGVQLGNDLLKISFTKYLIKAETPIDFTQLANNKTYWLEPLEMPSGSNADTRLSQLIGNKFINKSHTDSINLTLQYTFIADFNNEFLEQLFNYARYGTQGIAVDKISPNIIYTIHEIWCSWGDYKDKEIKAKIVENVDIENTESDTLTLSLTMQIQGEEQ